MIKKFIFTAVTGLCLTSSFAQTNILNTDFQTGIPTDYQIVVADTGTLETGYSEFAPGWIAIADPDDLNDTVAAACSYFTSATQADRWLITPALNLTSYGNYIKWQARSYDPSYPDTYLVMLSTTDTQLSSFTDTIGYVEYEWEYWTAREVNLTGLGYANQTVYVAFILNTTQGFKLFLNDIQVRVDDPLSVFEQPEISVNVFPNPTSEKITIQSAEAITELRILNVNGQEISTFENPGTTINLSDLDAGMYFLQLTTAKGSVTKRIEKR